ncbi:MAG TPA: M56 family metallopeptidase [Gemmatimonadaceae bacterium]
MIAWILYCLVVGTLLVVAARAAEWVAALAGRPVRWAWAAAIAVTFTLGAMAPLRRMLGHQDASTPSPATSVTLPLESIAQMEHQLPSSINSYAAIAWVVASVALIVLIAGVHARMRRARRAWPVAELHGARVRVSPRVGPVVIGMSRPEIVVPRWLLERSVEEQRLVVAHEAEHLAARDGLLLGAAYVAAAVMPWNPAIWVMFSRLRLAVELDCDARVLRGGVAAQAYGALLIDVAERALPFALGTLAFTKGPSHLKQRIVAMKRNIPKFARLRGGIVGVLGVAALLAACEAKMPTSGEIAAMDVGAAVHRAGALGVVPDQAVYIVDGKRVARTEALALKPEQIVSVNVSKSDTDYVEIHTTAVQRLAMTVQDANSKPVTRVDSVRGGPILIRDGAGALRPPTVEPLIFIDGVRSSMSALKAMDKKAIASVEVIKGASPTQLYGPEAAGGVIKVVTVAGAKR